MDVLPHENEEDNKKFIYKLSGYNRKINQECCGISLKKFLTTLKHLHEKIHKEAKKTGSSIKFKDFKEFTD